MKKTILFTVLIFQLAFAFGQTKTENKKGTKGMATGGYKSNRQETAPKTNNVNYNDRAYQNECYKNFAFTVKNYGYNKDGKFYSWGVAVKNNYSKAVQLKYKLIVGNDNSQNGTLTYYIKPGETYSNDFGKVKAIIVNNNSDQYKIEVSEVCFEGQDCNKNGYVDCNGKQSGLSAENLNKAVKTEQNSNVTPIPNLFNTSADYQVDAERIKNLFINSGFGFISSNINDNTIKFDEFYLSYVKSGTSPRYISRLEFRNIKSKDVYLKLYKLMGCEKTGDRECSPLQSSIPYVFICRLKN